VFISVVVQPGLEVHCPSSELEGQNTCLELAHALIDMGHRLKPIEEKVKCKRGNDGGGQTTTQRNPTPKKFGAAGLHMRSFAVCPDACHVCVAPHLKAVLDFLSKSSCSNERNKLEPQLRLNSYGMSAQFFPRQRSSAAINRIDYRISYP
jgi:hypothetical protein